MKKSASGVGVEKRSLSHSRLATVPETCPAAGTIGAGSKASFGSVSKRSLCGTGVNHQE
jgi:hypothetical protein